MFYGGLIGFNGHIIAEGARSHIRTKSQIDTLCYASTTLASHLRSNAKINFSRWRMEYNVMNVKGGYTRFLQA